eukprot:TRINITY_DN6446_c0_g7_i1.p1 TRINITY_DN6446_c0_g7~~TRINITY_DN6446_c0_g7_i1.p1  ORF type:complete len:764 (-),score=153.33 TRINITY_DN6446_c0_g7_i1:167-2458(-)
MVRKTMAQGRTQPETQKSSGKLEKDYEELKRSHGQLKNEHEELKGRLQTLESEHEEFRRRLGKLEEEKEPRRLERLEENKDSRRPERLGEDKDSRRPEILGEDKDSRSTQLRTLAAKRSNDEDGPTGRQKKQRKASNEPAVSELFARAKMASAPKTPTLKLQAPSTQGLQLEVTVEPGTPGIYRGRRVPPPPPKAAGRALSRCSSIPGTPVRSVSSPNARAKDSSSVAGVKSCSSEAGAKSSSSVAGAKSSSSVAGAIPSTAKAKGLAAASTFTEPAQKFVAITNPEKQRRCYEVLGVPRNATPDEMRKAYRRLALKVHPDKPGGDVKAFQMLSQAFELLYDPPKRTAYDRDLWRAGSRDGLGAGQTADEVDVGSEPDGPTRKANLEMLSEAFLGLDQCNWLGLMDILTNENLALVAFCIDNPTQIKSEVLAKTSPATETPGLKPAPKSSPKVEGLKRAGSKYFAKVSIENFLILTFPTDLEEAIDARIALLRIKTRTTELQGQPDTSFDDAVSVAVEEVQAEEQLAFLKFSFEVVKGPRGNKDSLRLTTPLTSSLEESLLHRRELLDMWEAKTDLQKIKAAHKDQKDKLIASRKDFIAARPQSLVDLRRSIERCLADRRQGVSGSRDWQVVAPNKMAILREPSMAAKVIGYLYSGCVFMVARGCIVDERLFLKLYGRAGWVCEKSRKDLSRNVLVPVTKGLCDSDDKRNLVMLRDGSMAELSATDTEDATQPLGGELKRLTADVPSEASSSSDSSTTSKEEA